MHIMICVRFLKIFDLMIVLGCNKLRVFVSSCLLIENFLENLFLPMIVCTPLNDGLKKNL
jgi:hypothetical protein